MVTTITLEEDALLGLPSSGDDGCLEEDAPPAVLAVVTTIALKEDALPRLRGSGDDALWRRMLRGMGTSRGGDDDCVGGRTTLVVQPIAREQL